MANVTDGLAAIKQLVFDANYISGEEFLQALGKKREGYETLYALVISSRVGHCGNDDDEVDELGRYGAPVYCELLEKRPTAQSGIFQAGLYPVSSNIPDGINLHQIR